MTYNKPEVLTLANAMHSIHGVIKEESFPDNLYPNYATPAAYEADE
jgi:hypothetical protein